MLWGMPREKRFSSVLEAVCLPCERLSNMRWIHLKGHGTVRYSPVSCVSVWSATPPRCVCSEGWWLAVWGAALCPPPPSAVGAGGANLNSDPQRPKKRSPA